MVNNTRDLLIALVERFEGLYLRPYLCPAGVPTIGLGTIRYPSGRPVTLSDPAITKEQAYEYAWHELAKCVKSLKLYSPNVLWKPSTTAALADFIYNLGAGAYRGSTLRKRVDQEDWGGAREQILRWNKAGGKVLRGLTTRRQAERAML